MKNSFKSKASEHVIQLQCIAWFRNEFERKGLGIIIPVVNEATYNNSAQVIKEGASDTIVVLPKIVLFIELKTAIGKQSEVQIRFQNQLIVLEYKYYLCRTLEVFKTIVYENL
jgi:hypothetical protein